MLVSARTTRRERDAFYFLCAQEDVSPSTAIRWYMREAVAKGMLVRPTRGKARKRSEGLAWGS